MKKVLLFLAGIALIIGCNQKPEAQKPEPFEYTLKGTVIGQDTGKFFFRESPRVGDEVFIPIENGEFSYSGKALDIYSTGIQFYEAYLNGGGRYFPMVIEPGLIEIELHKDSMFYKSKILNGDINIQFNNIMNIIGRYFDAIYTEKNTAKEIENLKNVYSDSLTLLIENNANNFSSVYLLNTFIGRDIFDDTQLPYLLNRIKDPELRRTPACKTAYSKYLSKKENINKKGEKAYNFVLPDSSGKLIDFSIISKNKIVYVERSGSWCGNQTNESKQLIPVYEDYNDKGFEIVTIVKEAKYDRWNNWLKSQKFSWYNVFEAEYGNINDVYYADMLFPIGDSYLVDENGVVIANDISASRLNEILMEKYEPEKYKKYISAKWDLPDGAFILDKDKPIKSFAKLASKYPCKAFFIDCWATWCSPCIEEFQYSASLKEFLKENNIEMVYIAFDKKLDDAKWLDYIRKYNLTGYNMRVNDEFHDDFINATGWNYALPSYYIIDQSGKIVQEQLLRPSEKEKLYDQIRELLNLKE